VANNQNQQQKPSGNGSYECYNRIKYEYKAVCHAIKNGQRRNQILGIENVGLVANKPKEFN
jgi:hypothetical protein